MSGGEAVTDLTGIIYFPLELLAAALIFSIPLKCRRYTVGRALLCVAAVAGCFLLFILNSFLLPAETQLPAVFTQATSFFWCAFLFLVCGFLPIWYIHETHIWEALYCAACAYLMEHLAYCARILCGLVLPRRAMNTGRWGYYLVIGIIYAAVYFRFARQMASNGKLMASARDSLALTLITLAMVVGMSLAATWYGFETAHAIYATFCCVAVLFGQLKQQKEAKFQTELALQQQMWSVHRTQYEMSRESIEAINRKCHDLKHQVAALKHIHDPRRQSEVIDSLQSAVNIYDAILETGNQILDTVLTEKSLICGNHDIALSCIADGRQLAFLDPVDLYTLVGNALDNAIEATVSLPAEERLIRLRVQEKAGLVLLQIENPYSGTIQLQDGLPLTHKADKQNHGFGVKSIRDITEKYQGILTLRAENGQFVLRITFLLCEQQFTADQ